VRNDEMRLRVQAIGRERSEDDEFASELEELGSGGNQRKEKTAGGAALKTAAAKLQGTTAAAWPLHAGSCMSTCARAANKGGGRQ
jgi:hypothetical protein